LPPKEKAKRSRSAQTSGSDNNTDPAKWRKKPWNRQAAESESD
jgi:hypothetical protein